MKAFQIDNYGGAEQLTERDIPAPAAEAGKVVVRVQAASLNPIDIKMASGDMRQMMPLSFPWTPGADFSGTVDTVGDGVDGIKPGDAVYGLSMGGGAYAEMIVMDAAMVGLKPHSLSDIEAASLALVGQTALQALDAADLKSGQTILIHGASGGVGSAAVQLAHHRGARVIATAPKEAADAVTALGADQVIDYKATPFESVVSGVDAILDTIGGDTQQRSFGVLKPGGCLVALSQPPSPDEAAKRNVRAVMLNTQSSRASLEALAQRIDAGELKPSVGKVYSLADVPTVWRDAPTLHIPGKIVFTVSS